MKPSVTAAPPLTKQSLRLFAAIAVAFGLYRIAVISHLDLDPFVDEAYYWSWAQALDWGYYSKPPMIAGLLAWSGWLFGDNLYALKVPSLVLYPATAFVVRQLGRELFDERAGFWAGIAFLTLPAMAALGLFASTDAPLLFFWAVGMLLLWRILSGGSLLHWLGLGVVTGLGLLSKYTMLAFVGLAAVVWLMQPGRARRTEWLGPAIAAAVAFLIFCPNLLWNWRFGFPTFQHTAEITRVGDWAWNLRGLLEFAGSQWLGFGPLLTACLVLGLMRVRNSWHDPRFRFLFIFVVPLLALVALQALFGRANGNWSAPAFIAATLASVAYVGADGRWRLVMVAVAINAVAGLAVYHWPDLVRLSGDGLSARTDPYKRARGWHELTEAVRPHLAANPGAVLVADDRELLAQLVYGLRPRDYARWQATPHVMDHYGLTSPLTPASGDPIVLVSIRHDPDYFDARFATTQRLADIDIAVYPDLHRRASIWLLRGFRGY